MSSEKGVRRPGEIDFINDIQFEELFDQGASTFAEEGVDFGSVTEFFKKSRELGPVNRCREVRNFGVIADNEVSRSALGMEERVGRIELSGFLDDTSPWSAILDVHRHLICFQGAPSYQNGIGFFSNLEETFEVLF